jgi:AcrR family transcriptional regulator
VPQTQPASRSGRSPSEPEVRPERDADATRRRLLAAATAEFAQHGIAGARVDRIAAAARSNKAQIYHYFGSKDGLFDAVFGAYVTEAAQAEYFDGRDLPATAGRLFDEFVGRPDLARLATWYRLERTGSPPSITPIVDANEVKVASIAAAQADGVVTDAFPPEVLLGLVITLAMAWVSLPPEFEGAVDAYPVATRRAFVVDAVARLVAPR